MDFPHQNPQIGLDFQEDLAETQVQATKKERRSVVEAVALVSGGDFYRPKAPSLQTRRRLLASVAWAQTVALVLVRYGLPKDIRCLILWNYLGGNVFHSESETLRCEKIWAPNPRSLISDKEVRQRTRLQRCILFETKFLQLETGTLETLHLTESFRRHVVPEQLNYCYHHGCWARLRGLALMGSNGVLFPE